MLFNPKQSHTATGSIFVIVKTKTFGIDGGRFVLSLFYILSIQHLFSVENPYFCFGKIDILCKNSTDSK